MSYRRNSPYRSSIWRDYATNKTKVVVSWSEKSGAYSIYFSDTKNWTQMQVLIGYLKGIPYGERDYDSENKTWFLMEKHIPQFKAMVDCVAQWMDLEFHEKPTGQSNTAKFISNDVLLQNFQNLTGVVLRDKSNGVELDYQQAKREYRKVCMKFHPDITKSSEPMSSINEIWTQLELNYFKTRKEIEYEQTTTTTV